jgi:transcriptional regulator with XRE-family HTH domain
MTKLTVMETFAKNVRITLARKGWTIQQLADALQTDRSNLSKIVRGIDGCTLERAVRIAKALEVPLSVLTEEFSEIYSSAS